MDEFGKSPIRTFTNFIPNSFSDEDSQIFIVGVAGGSASGKSTVNSSFKFKTKVCKQIVESLKEERVAIICQDAFYKNLNEKEIEKVNNNEFNFDHPEAFDDKELLKCIKDLKKGKTVQIPQYDYTENKRKKETTELSGATVIILEGILTLYQKEIRDLMDIKIFVDTDPDTRIIRRCLKFYF
jgi:uridine kinase